MNEPRKYNLGCGPEIWDGWVNADLPGTPDIDMALDLNTKGWGAELYPASQIASTDVLEHLDDAVAFMNECWDALVPDGLLILKVCGENNITRWRDPQHKRPYRLDSFDFFAEDTDVGYRYHHYTDKKWRILWRDEDELGSLHLKMTPVKRNKPMPGPVAPEQGEPEREPEPVVEVKAAELPTVELVLPYRDWCLERMARILEGGMTQFRPIVTEAPEGVGDICYHIPWHTGLEPAVSKVNVAWFTHLTPGDETDARWIAENMDHCTVPSIDAKSVVVNKVGLRDDQVTVIHHGLPSGFRPNKIRIGTAGRAYRTGRKREWIWQELVWRGMSMEPFELLFIGGGWERPVEALRIMHVHAEMASVEYEEIPGLMKGLDYYLATGFSEGGPFGIQEALACGVPVISYPTGIAVELAEQGVVELYETVDDLRAILERISGEVITRVKSVKAWTWPAHVKQHEALFLRLLEQYGGNK